MSKKVRSTVPSKTKASIKNVSKIRARNPLALNPLMKKSHAHTKSAKAERAKDKQALKKELRKRDQTD